MTSTTDQTIARLLDLWVEHTRRQRLRAETTERIPVWYLFEHGGPVLPADLLAAWQCELAAFHQPEPAPDRREYFRERRAAQRAAKWQPRDYTRK